MAICVLTGDIVGSTKLTTAQQRVLPTILQRAHDTLVENQNVAVVGSLDVFRGDGWQMHFDTRDYGLRFALFVRAFLKSYNDEFATRIAISEANETFASTERHSDAFVASGRTLDSMPSDLFMSHASKGYKNAAAILADTISRDWTTAQARAITPFLLPGSTATQRETAADLLISRQAVGQALDAANYTAIKAALAAIEEQAK